VGTTTEVYDYLRVLFARIGVAHCPKCCAEITPQTPQQIVQSILKLPQGSKIQLLAPAIGNMKGQHKELLSKYISLGFSRARIDKDIVRLDDDISLDKNKKHNIDIVIDRVVMKEGITKRLTDSVEYTLKLADGDMIVLCDEKEIFYSEKAVCHKCDLSFPALEPQLFSFNSPLGACQTCNGLGQTKVMTESSLLFDENLPPLEGGLAVFTKKNTFLYNMTKTIFEEEGINKQTPYKSLKKSFKKLLLYGTDKVYSYSFRSQTSYYKFSKAFPGIIPWLTKKYHESLSEKTHRDLEEFMEIETCPECNGNRLNSFALATTINDKNIMQVCNFDITNTGTFFDQIQLNEHQTIIAANLLKEIRSRLHFLLDVGLNYLSLNRAANTLSGGESQRIRLATQIGSALSGVLYVLDEPSIGLHPRDNDRLIKTLLSLKNLGNTVVVVEHDAATIKHADHLVDIGPGAGIHGGEVIFQGPIDKVIKDKKSLTGRYLSHELSIPVPPKRRELNQFLKLKGATKNNLDNLSVNIPLGGIVCITGVSGSGKSTLIHDILVPAVKNSLSKNYKKVGSKTPYNSLTGTTAIQSVIELDQSPIGRTPKSNPATYTGIFDDIRKVFAATNESKIRGYKPGRFSFNVKGGRCEACEGNGLLKIEMHFLPDVYITCPDCYGKRYNEETLSVLYKAKNIFEILDMTIEEAQNFFANHTRINRILSTLLKVGLGYMKLGQPATTLSGGEAQRMKLARELGKRPKGHCLYILDEPTTGLHFSDIHLLLDALHSLTDQGHTVLIIEHNLDVIKTADHIIDLGPEGGNKGGKIIFEGTPEELAKDTSSYTGKFLKPLLNS
ncbi:MAG: excinuclease ABC subunit UvrA, partial [Bacteriovoracia bacterium]